MNGIPFKILIVEDDIDDAEMINEAFFDIGYAAEVKKFTTGEALLRYLAQIEKPLYPSLIVLDNGLPLMDAPELLRILKNDQNYRSIPVLVYSTHLSENKKKQLQALGSYRCLEKGNTIHELVDVATELRGIAESKNNQSEAI